MNFTARFLIKLLNNLLLCLSKSLGNIGPVYDFPDLLHVVGAYVLVLYIQLWRILKKLSVKEVVKLHHFVFIIDISRHHQSLDERIYMYKKLKTMNIMVRKEDKMTEQVRTSR